MKKLLVPTDFSDSATFAADVAMAIAPKLGAEVHFYTRVHLHPDWDELSENAKMDYPESFANLQEAKENFKNLRQRYSENPTRILTSYSSGDFVDVVANYVDEEDIYMIVMGSSGAEGVKEFLFGSNAQKVVRNAHCPVLIIKHQVENPEFKQIVFASDFRNAAKKPFERLMDFGWHFGSQLHLLNVDPDPTFKELDAGSKGSMDEFQKMCWKLPCTKHEFGDVNVELGITHFATDNKIDLIAIAHYGEEDFFKRFFGGSITESLVNHLEMPLLVINTRQLKTWKFIDQDETVNE